MQKRTSGGRSTLNNQKVLGERGDPLTESILFLQRDEIIASGQPTVRLFLGVVLDWSTWLLGLRRDGCFGAFLPSTSSFSATSCFAFTFDGSFLTLVTTVCRSCLTVLLGFSGVMCSLPWLSARMVHGSLLKFSSSNCVIYDVEANLRPLSYSRHVNLDRTCHD